MVLILDYLFHHIGLRQVRRTHRPPSAGTWATGCSPSGSRRERLRISSEPEAARTCSGHNAVIEASVSVFEIDYADLSR